MTLPPIHPQDAIVAQRLESYLDPGNSPVDRGFYYAICGSCSFQGWDGTFVAWPGRAHRGPSELVAFIEREARQAGDRKCPECHGEARLSGIRAFVASESLGHDLVVDHERRGRQTSFLLMDQDGNVGTQAPEGEALRTACLDSCLRAAGFVADLTPDQAERARELFRFVADARPEESDAHLGLAQLCVNDGQYDDAIRHGQDAGRYAEGDAAACAALGALFGNMAVTTADGTRLQDAARWYTTAMELEPENRQLDLSLGRLLVQTGNFAEAAVCLDRAEKDAVCTTEARYLQGVSALHQGRVHAAAELFEELSRDVPGDPSVFQMWAWAAAQLGDRETAERTLGHARSLAGETEEQSYFVELVTEALKEAGEDPA